LLSSALAAKRTVVLLNIVCMALLCYCSRERAERRTMEGKRVAAATLYCMLIMLSVSGQQQQVAGLCGCFGDCYHDCREGHRHPGWFCTVKCVETCVAVSDEVHGATVGAAAGCSEICFTTSICGVAQTTDGK
jgi:hypothetical protein